METKKPRKQQDDRLLRHFTMAERRRQVYLRTRIKQDLLISFI